MCTLLEITGRKCWPYLTGMGKAVFSSTREDTPEKAVGKLLVLHFSLPPSACGAHSLQPLEVCEFCHLL